MRVLLAAMGLIFAGWGATSALAVEPQMCRGFFHGMALASDGRVFTWGNDYEGQLGNGRLLYRATPGEIPGLSGAVAVAAGADFGAALLGDGRIATWGANDEGQRGDTTLLFRGNTLTYAQVPAAAQVSAGGRHAVALARDGSVWTWGANGSGQLGDGTRSQRPRPQRVEGLSQVVHVMAGPSSTVAIQADGSAWMWGYAFGTDYALLPRRVAGIAGAVASAVGTSHALFLLRDGTVLGFGDNYDGQLGDLAAESSITPVPIRGLAGVVAISAGGSHNAALRGDGEVVTWGSNSSGQLGVGQAGSPRLPQVVGGTGDIRRIAAGPLSTFAVRADGTLLAWGYNESGGLGIPPANATIVTQPTAVPIDAPVEDVEAGPFTLALANGRVLAFGDNSFNQLASGTASGITQSTPSAVPGLDSVVAIACAESTSFALRADGTLWAWGSNYAGTRGDSNFLRRSSPAPVAGLPPLAGVYSNAISYHALAIDREGQLWAWGYNAQGQLGNGGIGDYSLPARVDGLPRMVHAATNEMHSLAAAVDGSVWVWGDNEKGQLGDGSTTARPRPVRLEGVTNAVEVAAGREFSLARMRDGTVWSWGQAGDGSLGRGVPATAIGPPAPIPSLAGVRQIAAGLYHAHAVLADDTLVGWGLNFFGSLGDDSGDPVFYSPVRIRTDAPVTHVAAGATHSGAVGRKGPALGWGFNVDAQVGDGTLADRSAPALLVSNDGRGFLDLRPGEPLTIPLSKVPPFPVVAKGSIKTEVVADVTFNASDIGRQANVYVFAWAPAGKVKRRAGPKADPVACVLAQLTSSGVLREVSASELQSYVSGVLREGGQAVTVLNGADAGAVNGSTLFVGYGSDPADMLNTGNHRSVAGVDTAECRPQAPQTGWWWNPAEPGRGYSIEASGNRLFFAAFMYEPSGRATWYVAAGTTAIDGSLFSNRLLAVSGGQSLSGAYRAPSTKRDVGPIALAFNTARRGTLVMGGAAVPIERFDIVPEGLRTGPPTGTPEAGWWWNPQEDGRGFFIEWQKDSAYVAGYMYTDAGEPVWYAALAGTPDPASFQSNWIQFGNGQALGGPWKPHATMNPSVAPVRIQFDGPDTAFLTLPGGNRTRLSRFRF